MNNLQKLAIVAVCLAAVSVAYYFGRQQNTEQISELSKQVSELQALDQEAAVVKRVSQQMEDIAYQQKSISDEQRIRAEQQSALAMENYRRAEEESRKAKELSKQAENERLRAELEKQVAIEAEQEARKQRDQAQKQKQISDVLSYRSISRSLGSAALSLSEENNEDLIATLSYASYYFARICDGNVYQNETYSALADASHQIRSTVLPNNSPIYDLATVPEGCVAVSIYGDVVRFSCSDSKQSITSDVMLQNNQYDFRSVIAKGNDIWVLSHEGTLIHFPLMKTYTVPQDLYSKMVELNDDCLLLQANRNLYLFSRKSGTITHQEPLSSPLSCMAVHKGLGHLFFTNGKQAMIDASGKLTEVASSVKDVVTTCLFDDDDRCYMGTNRGAIYCVRQGDIINLIAHTSAVSDMKLIGKDVLITSSYDHTVKIWNLPKLQLEDTNNKAYVSAGKTDASAGLVENEWVVPASFEYDGWPLALSLSADNHVLWIGTSTGQITTLPASVDYLAQQVQKQARSLTSREWQTYIGQVSEPIDFKNVKF